MECKQTQIKSPGSLSKDISLVLSNQIELKKRILKRRRNKLYVETNKYFFKKFHSIVLLKVDWKDFAYFIWYLKVVWGFLGQKQLFNSQIYFN